ncbi:MAG: methyltransferase [Streptosporangiales bacterium]|nr:methyltransferase [Streptosporangiales bacterium]
MVDPREGAFTRATGREVEGNHAQPRYRRYQFDLISPHCGRSILEVGAGVGEFSAQFTDRERLVLTDVDPIAVDEMGKRFADRSEIEACQLDLDGSLELDGEPVESVVAINVLEHIEDDVAALKSLARLVVPGGTIVLWVPAYQTLYGDFDRKVGHVRRYTPATMRGAVEAAGLTTRVCRPVNFLGGLAWWLAVRIGGTGSPRPGMVAVYDRLVVPVTRIVDRLRPPFGQTVLCVVEVPA